MVKRAKYPVWPWVLLGLTIAGSGLLALLLIGAVLVGDTRPKVGLIELSGPIDDEGTTSVLGGSQGGGRNFVRDVEEARRDPSVRAVVIRINSPGGSASASQEMFAAVQRLRKTKPVICSMGDVAASGGYYVAAACDKIYANGATTTGSIGVISFGFNINELATRNGIKDDTVKSARLKGGANPLAPIDPLDRARRKVLIENIYAQFVADVLTGRAKATKGKLTRAKLLPLANGSVYTGAQAKANLLIDELGGLQDALRYAAKLGNLTEQEPSVKNLSESVSRFSTSSGGELPALARELGRGIGSAFSQGVVEAAKAEARGDDRLIVQAR